jgi:hypothetical protein
MPSTIAMDTSSRARARSSSAGTTPPVRQRWPAGGLAVLAVAGTGFVVVRYSDPLLTPLGPDGGRRTAEATAAAT